MPNFSSLARLEVPEKFLWWLGRGCKLIFVQNPTVVLRLGWGFDNLEILWRAQECSRTLGSMENFNQKKDT